MSKFLSAVFSVAIGLSGHGSNAFYMPGVRPHTFADSEEMPLKVNALTSIHTQIPKDYYRLPFCKPQNGPEMASENLGEFLTGNKIQNSPYVLKMREEKFCQILCQSELSELEARNLRMHIKYGYHNNWIIDNLPSASIGLNDENGLLQTHYAGGFPIGFVDIGSDDKKDVYVFNHVNIVLEIHQPENESGHRVVGFKVEPISVNHQFNGDFQWDGMSPEGYTRGLQTCPSAGTHMDRNGVMSNQIVREGEKIIYSYDVIFVNSPVAWSSRWDVYLTENHLVPPQVHWYSITNSILVVLFLSMLVISILVRNLRRDIASYNAMAALSDEEKEEEIEESGWKLIHADVFRPPQNHPMLYCVCVGSGVQIAVSLGFIIALSAIGFLNPARRGSLMQAVLVLYMLCGSLAGYVSSRLYKTFRGRNWQLCTVFTATLFPGGCFAVFIFFNIILAFFRSSGSVPFLDVLIVAAMWCCVSIPLVFIGAYFGYKTESMSFPTVTSTIARSVPEPTFFMNPKLAIAAAGIVPFSTAYVELFFIMTSLWMDQFYYVFGFTFIVYCILIVTVAEVTVLLVYYQLCSENHRWWWLSFFIGASTSAYMMVYSLFWFRALEASKLWITYLLYFGYMMLLSGGLCLITGMVGSLTSLWFVRKIFSSIKVD